MRRLPGWRARMKAMVDELRRVPFKWGDHDCGPAWGARHVDLMLGTDFQELYEGIYGDALGARRWLKELGHASLEELVSSRLPEIHPSQARVGDLAAIATDGPFGCSLGIVNGERILVLGADGIMTVGLLTASRAWKVGDA